jgi:hypothetical protein
MVDPSAMYTDYGVSPTARIDRLDRLQQTLLGTDAPFPQEYVPGGGRLGAAGPFENMSPYAHQPPSPASSVASSVDGLAVRGGMKKRSNSSGR